MSKKRPVLSEAQLRQIIYDELIAAYLLKEDTWNDVKSGAQKLEALERHHARVHSTDKID